MTAALVAATLLLPLLLAVLLWLPRVGDLVLRMTPLAPLPALALGLLAADFRLELPGVVYGVDLGLDLVGRVFLLFTAAIWSLAGLHLQTSGLTPSLQADRRFLFSFLIAMAGNLGTTLALDAIGFYVMFGILTFAAYGMIVTRTAADSRRAGRLYLTIAIIGEMAMLTGFLLAAGGATGLAVAAFLYLGMGVKHGVLPLHVWLPPAHGTAPSPASALLSGALLKAGVLGWIRFLPLAAPALPDMAAAMAALGLVAAFYGALLGSLQQKPKMLLAYSSISQMGIVTAAFAPAAAAPTEWWTVMPVLALLALHHAMVKASLFLGVGADGSRAGGRLIYPALILASLALMGLPPFGGFLGKMWVDQFLYLLPASTAAWYGALLPFTSTATTILMGRFLWLMCRQAQPHAEGPAAAPASPAAALLLLVLALTAPAALAVLIQSESGLWLEGGYLWKAAWPILLGGVVVAVGILGARRGMRLPLSIPPGDIVVPLERAADWFVGGCSIWLSRFRGTTVRVRLPTLSPMEARLRRLSVTGVVYLALLVALALASGYL